MKHKNRSVIYLVAFLAMILAIAGVIGVLGLTGESYEANSSAHFHDIYDAVREKYPFITSFRQETGDDGIYNMYYIECDITDTTNCFEKLVDIQREINAIMEARKHDEWFNNFKGHIEVISGERSLRVFYDNGSVDSELWANDITSDDYSILLDAFPVNDKLILVIFHSEYSANTDAETIQEYKGRNITIIHQGAK